ncbi:MAG: hypothetical protein AAB834_00495 [Patescibacteria group bacterium]
MEKRLSVKQKIRLTSLGLAAAIVGDSGEIITDYAHVSELRDIMPNAVNYFQHSGSMLYGGILGLMSMALAAGLPERSSTQQSASRVRRIASAAGMALAIGGMVQSLPETETGINLARKNPISSYLINYNPHTDIYDTIWGTGFTVLVAGGLASRRHTMLEAGEQLLHPAHGTQ